MSGDTVLFTPFTVYVVVLPDVEDEIPFIKGITVGTFAYFGLLSVDAVPLTHVSSIGNDKTVPLVETLITGSAFKLDVATINGYGFAP